MDAVTSERIFIAQLLDHCSRQWPCGHKRGGPAGVCGSKSVTLSGYCLTGRAQKGFRGAGEGRRDHRIKSVGN